MRSLVLSLMLLAPALLTAQDPTSTAVYQQACGSADDKLDANLQTNAPAAVPEQGQALLYFVQDQDEIGATCINCGVTIRLGADGKWVGVTNGNSYAAVSLAPGHHHLCANWQSHLKKISHREIFLYPLDVEAGKVYYFRVHVTASANSALFALSLEPLNEDEAKLLLGVEAQSTMKK